MVRIQTAISKEYVVVLILRNSRYFKQAQTDHSLPAKYRLIARLADSVRLIFLCLTV